MARQNKFFCIFSMLLLICVVSCSKYYAADTELPVETAIPTARTIQTVPSIEPEFDLPDEIEVPKDQLPEIPDLLDSPTSTPATPTPTPATPTPTPAAPTPTPAAPTPTPAAPTPTPAAPTPTPAAPTPTPAAPTPTPAAPTPTVTQGDIPSGNLVVDVETENEIFYIAGTSFQEEALELIEMTNSEREAEGLPALEYDGTLCSTAFIRSAEITVNWSHTRPNGKRWTSLSDSINGENLAYGFDTSGSVLNAWMGSEGHRELILSPEFTRIGAAVFQVDGTLYWVQHFGC